MAERVTAPDLEAEMMLRNAQATDDPVDAMIGRVVALIRERDALRAALETAESERDRFRAALSTPEWDNNGNCQLCANRFAYVHSLGCPRQRH